MTEEQAYKLDALFNLKQKGAITEDEYEREKTKILGSSKSKDNKTPAPKPQQEPEIKSNEHEDAPHINHINQPSPPSQDASENKPGCVSGCMNLIFWIIILAVIANYIFK